MWTPESELEENAEKLGVKYRRLDVALSKSIYESVCQTFTSNTLRGRLFEKLVESVSLTGEQAWNWFGQYPETSTVLVFCEDRRNLFEFAELNSVVLVYYECPLFTIYVTNPNLDFLLVYTEEQILIAAGKAADWLESVLQQAQPAR